MACLLKIISHSVTKRILQVSCQPFITLIAHHWNNRKYHHNLEVYRLDRYLLIIKLFNSQFVLVHRKRDLISTECYKDVSMFSLHENNIFSIVI